MAQLLHTAQAGSTQSLAPTATAVTRVMARVVLTWQQRRRDRQTLSRLDPHLLRDIGLEMRDACLEAEKPFWRA